MPGSLSDFLPNFLISLSGWPLIVAALVVGYLFGSIPFGVVLTKLAGGPDLRTVGSGNIGATNVLRTGNKGLAAATLLGDGLKGTVAVLIATALWGPYAGLIAALGAFLGHLFPVWLRFQGGKGVATFLGCLLAVDWRVGLAFIAVWIVTAAISRYSSLSALLASAAAPLGLWWFGNPLAAELFLVLTAFLWWKHRDNLKRLVSGTESHIGRKG
jgi:acyl phosphate:glycerol-3-phosphate acyltransferase